MFICPTCNREYPNEEEIKKHSMICWRKANPHYKSKPAPKGETVITKNTNQDIINFFNSFERGE